MALALALAAAPQARAGAPAPSPSPPPLTAILSNTARALGYDPTRQGIPLEVKGTIIGEGLHGAFETWRGDGREREDETLGLRLDRTLRIGDRWWEEDENGAVHELRGTLLRRARTEELIDSGAFTADPSAVQYVRTENVFGRPAYRLDVTAPGGDAESVDIDAERWLPVRLQYVESDGITSVDLSDWRVVAGEAFAFRSTTSNGSHGFDVVELTTGVTENADIPPSVFAPLVGRTIDAPTIQTIALEEQAGHYLCPVSIGGHIYHFLLDTGAVGVLLDLGVAKALGLRPQGSMQAYGATRTGGLGLVRIPGMRIGTASLGDVVAATLPLSRSTGGTLRADGILGSTLFAAAMVQFDFARHIMRLGVPGSLPAAGEPVTLDVDRSVPEAALSFDGTHTGTFVIDTGNGGEVLLYQPFVDANPGIVPFTGQSQLSYGIGGTTTGYQTSLDQLTLGNLPFYDVPTQVVLATQGAFADRIDAGNVGLAILNRLVVTFDESNAVMYVQPGSTYDGGRAQHPLP